MSGVIPNLRGGVRFSTSNTSTFTNEVTNDIMVYAQTPGQNILIGQSNSTGSANIQITSNYVNVAHTMNVAELVQSCGLTLSLGDSILEQDVAQVNALSSFATIRDSAYAASNYAYAASATSILASDAALAASNFVFETLSAATDVIGLSNAAFSGSNEAYSLSPSVSNLSHAVSVFDSAVNIFNHDGVIYYDMVEGVVSHFPTLHAGQWTDGASNSATLNLSSDGMTVVLPSGGSNLQTVTITSNGYMGIGPSATSPAYPVTVGTTNSGGTVSIYAAGDVQVFSDLRVKTDLVQIPDALDKVRAITGYTYVRTDLPDSGTSRQAGVIAQDVEAVLPEVVHTDSVTGLKSVAYGNMVALLVEAIKILADRVDALGSP